MIRAAIVGFGNIGHFVLEAVLALSGKVKEEP